jgi:hypothetical protein
MELGFAFHRKVRRRHAVIVRRFDVCILSESVSDTVTLEEPTRSFVLPSVYQSGDRLVDAGILGRPCVEFRYIRTGYTPGGAPGDREATDCVDELSSAITIIESKEDNQTILI